MAVCAPVFVPVSVGEDGQAVDDVAGGAEVLWVPTARTAAATSGFFYTQIGIDYGMEVYHGKITGLATV